VGRLGFELGVEESAEPLSACSLANITALRYLTKSLRMSLNSYYGRRRGVALERGHVLISYIMYIYSEEHDDLDCDTTRRAQFTDTKDACVSCQRSFINRHEQVRFSLKSSATRQHLRSDHKYNKTCNKTYNKSWKTCTTVAQLL